MPAPGPDGEGRGDVFWDEMLSWDEMVVHPMLTLCRPGLTRALLR